MIRAMRLMPWAGTGRLLHRTRTGPCVISRRCGVYHQSSRAADHVDVGGAALREARHAGNRRIGRRLTYDRTAPQRKNQSHTRCDRDRRSPTAPKKIAGTRRRKGLPPSCARASRSTRSRGNPRIEREPARPAPLEHRQRCRNALDRYHAWDHRNSGRFAACTSFWRQEVGIRLGVALSLECPRADLMPWPLHARMIASPWRRASSPTREPRLVDSSLASAKSASPSTSVGWESRAANIGAICALRGLRFFAGRW